jgi:ascorbate-specific PTS system EIIC-type component UlaA
MVSIGARIIRAIFVGSTIGIFGGIGLFLLATAVNVFASSQVLPPIGFLLLGFGGSLVAAVGVELSSDMAEKQNGATNQNTG